MIEYKEPGVVVLMYDDQGVWLSERLNAESFNGYWQGAGGGVEKGESLFHTALRELEEESGLCMPRNRVIFHGTDREAEGPRGETFMLHYFSVKLAPGEVPQNTEPEKHGPWVKFARDDTRKLKLMPGLKHDFYKRWIKWNM